MQLLVHAYKSIETLRLESVSMWNGFDSQFCNKFLARRTIFPFRFIEMFNFKEMARNDSPKPLSFINRGGGNCTIFLLEFYHLSRLIA